MNSLSNNSRACHLQSVQFSGVLSDYGYQCPKGWWAGPSGLEHQALGGASRGKELSKPYVVSETKNYNMAEASLHAIIKRLIGNADFLLFTFPYYLTLKINLSFVLLIKR